MQDHDKRYFPDFHPIGMDECLDLARDLNATGKAWHMHVLSPGCQHNPFPAVYAIVIEDDSAGIAYLAKGDLHFPEVDKDLVKMLHGDDIIDAGKLKPERPSSPLLQRLEGLQAHRIPWHHHMHFPNCAFNPHPGHWSISVEAPDTFFSEFYPEEPVDILREIEVLYFSNLKPSA